MDNRDIYEREAWLLQRASGQDGVVGRADIEEAGLHRRVVKRREEAGRWQVVAPGVWRINGAPPTWRQSLRAGLLWLGTQAVISGFAAAALWGFDGFPERPVEFLVPRGLRGYKAGPFEVHTTLTLETIDRTTHGGFPVTTASRTVVDLAARQLSSERLGNAIDSAVRDGWSSPAYLRQRIDVLRGPGRHGVRLLDELMGDSGGHSFLERAFLRLVREHGLPRPECQVIHRRDGRTVARVDFQFTPLPLIVEVSGRLGHVTDADRLRDARRRNELQEAGFLVIEYLYHEVVNQPAEVARRLRKTIRDLTPAA